MQKSLMSCMYTPVPRLHELMIYSSLSSVSVSWTLRIAGGDDHQVTRETLTSTRYGQRHACLPLSSASSSSLRPHDPVVVFCCWLGLSVLPLCPAASHVSHDQPSPSPTSPTTIGHACPFALASSVSASCSLVHRSLNSLTSL